MKSPFTGGTCTLMHETREVTYRKDKFEYVAQYWICDDTGDEFTTTDQDGASLAQVYNSYREKFGIPYPDEIIGLREKYGLSCASMSSILGFGSNQWRLYEQGEVPSVSNGRMIRSIMKPEVMLDLVENSKNFLSKQEVEKISKKVKAAFDEGERSLLDGFEESRVFLHKRGAVNGYAPESLSRLKNILLIILDKCGDLWFTKMNKMLFYIDFVAYRERGMALTGLSYKAIEFGPVPERWDRVFSEFDSIRQIPKSIREFEGIVLHGSEKPDLSLFSEQEISIIEKVCDKFKDMSSHEISILSHEESAWKDCVSKHSTIPFSDAFSLKAI